jgi:Holliday junction resolvasome RuvABC endonuclease subunit
MIIIGIDQSYRSPGYCVFKDGELIDFGCLLNDKRLDVFDQASLIAEGAVNLIKSHNPNSIYIEGLAFGSFGNATRDLAGLQFLMIASMRKHLNLKQIEIVAPTALKKFATGKGKASKDDMINAAPPEIIAGFKKQGYLKTKGLTDLIDAYWLGKFARNKLTTDK